jgi:tRNA (cytidine32/guanosine34-2'-O)-methyltransferase
MRIDTVVVHTDILLSVTPRGHPLGLGRAHPERRRVPNMGKSTRSKDKRDIYYRKAKEEGWRARSAFKLLQIDEHFDIFAGVCRAVDLCAAPGSWSQVLSRKLLGGLSAEERPDTRIVAVDLQEMAPIDGVSIIAGDITSQATVNEILELFRQGDTERLADLVVCDGAPDVTGMHDLDEYIQGQLLLSALSITTQLLRDGGTFVAKIFRGRGSPLLYAQLKVFFPEVYVAKPKSSRNSSVEAFVVGRGFHLPDSFRRGVLRHVSDYAGGLCDAESSSSAESTIVPFVACGDLSGYDADASYPLEPADGESSYQSMAPTQKPTTPAYRAYLEQKQSEGGRRVVLDSAWTQAQPAALDSVEACAAGEATITSMDASGEEIHKAQRTLAEERTPCPTPSGL